MTASGNRGDRTPQARDGELDLDGFQEERVGPDLASRGAALLDLKARWQALSARQQLRLKRLGVAGAIGALGFGLYSASSDKAEEAVVPPSSHLDMGAGLRGDSLEIKLRGDLKKILDGQTLLGERVTAIEEGKIVPGSGAAGEIGGDLPPAMPGSVPEFPEPPTTGDIDPSVSAPPAPPAAPSAPPAPPAPPVEKTVGAIGAATSPVAATEAAAGAKKTYGPPRLQVGF